MHGSANLASFLNSSASTSVFIQVEGSSFLLRIVIFTVVVVIER